MKDLLVHKINRADCLNIARKKKRWHQQFGGEKVCFLLFNICSLAGSIVAQPDLEAAINVNIVKIMQQVVSKLVGGCEVSAIRMVIGVHTDDS